MSEHEIDKLLGELFKENAPRVNDALLRERVTKSGLRRERSRRRVRQGRMAAVAFASIVLAVGIGYGTYRAITYSRGPNVVVVLTDSTVTTALTGNTGASSVSGTSVQAEDKTTKDLLATYSTKWTGAIPRQANVKLTTQYATNVILAPGEEYDFDKQIGARTAERGFKVAPGIVGPADIEDVMGGAITQVATTLFNAACGAGLKIEERHNHSIYIDHYPKGRDATVTGGGKNLRFVNDTKHYVLIQGASDGITTTIKIYGTSDGRKVSWSVGDFYDIVPKTTVRVDAPNLAVGKTQVNQSGQVGRELKTQRVVTMPDGTVLHDDIWVSVWPMYPETIAVGTMKPTTTP